MDWRAIWEWLRPMVGFFMLGVVLLLVVYLIARTRKKGTTSTPEK